MLGVFPSQGKLPDTDHFIRENFIGLDFLHAAFTVSYEGDYRLFVIKGKDPQEVMDMALAYLKFTGQEIDPAKVHSFVLKDKYNGNIPVVLKGSFLAGIIDGDGNTAARQNLDALVGQLGEN